MKRRKKLTRTDADILAARQMLRDSWNGKQTSFATYDRLSDKLCGKPSRKIYEGD